MTDVFTTCFFFFFLNNSTCPFTFVKTSPVLLADTTVAFESEIYNREIKFMVVEHAKSVFR